MPPSSTLARVEFGLLDGTAAKRFAVGVMVALTCVLRSASSVCSDTLNLPKQYVQKVYRPPPAWPFAACICMFLERLGIGGRGWQGGGGRRGRGRMIHSLFHARYTDGSSQAKLTQGRCIVSTGRHNGRRKKVCFYDNKKYYAPVRAGSS